MQCIQFEERFHAVLDQRQRPQEDDVLLAHAAMCADCQNLLEGEDALSLGLTARSRAKPKRIVAASLASRTTTPRAETEQRFAMPYRAATLVGLAASIALIAFLLRLDPVQTPTAARLDLELVHPARLADERQLRPAGIADESPLETGDDITAVLDRWAVLASSELTAQLEYGPTANSLLLLTGRFRPLADPFVVLFDVLRRSLGWQTPPPTHPGAT